jgi:hypothetical protein
MDISKIDTFDDVISDMSISDISIAKNGYIGLDISEIGMYRKSIFPIPLTSSFPICPFRYVHIDMSIFSYGYIGNQYVHIDFPIYP